MIAMHQKEINRENDLPLPIELNSIQWNLINQKKSCVFACHLSMAPNEILATGYDIDDGAQ